VTYLCLHVSLLLPHRHFPIVKQPLQLILERPRLLSQSLPQNINFVLQLRSFRAHALIPAFPRIPDFGFQLATCGAEEVGFVFNVGFGDEAGARERHVGDEHSADGFHERCRLVARVCRFVELAHEAVGVEVVHVGGCAEVRRAVVLFVLGRGHVEDAVGRFRFRGFRRVGWFGGRCGFVYCAGLRGCGR
jgi:hypothetical protein